MQLIYEYLWQTLLAAYTKSTFPLFLTEFLCYFGAATCSSAVPNLPSKRGGPMRCKLRHQLKLSRKLIDKG